MNTTALPWCLGAFLVISGCGVKPQPVVPSDVSIDRILAAVRGQSEAVRDFSSAGKVTVSDAGGVRTSGVIFRFIRPDRFKLDIRGFGGVEVASVGSDGDSLTVYIPLMNGYLRTGKDAAALARLAPQLDAGISLLAPLAAGVIPLPGELERCFLTMRAWKHEAELAAREGDSEFRYLVRGPDLRVVELHMTEGGGTSWSMRRSEFGSCGPLAAPRTLRFERDGRTLSVRFASCSVNTGLTGADLRLDMPEDAERLAIPNPAAR